MGEVVNLGALQKTRRASRNEVPEGGAIILLFTGIQYVRDEETLTYYERQQARFDEVKEPPCMMQRRVAKGRRSKISKH
ncbi:MAG: hypothetical protein AB7F96_02660 [Beijerinckiaceae bacterium]